MGDAEGPGLHSQRFEGPSCFSGADQIISQIGDDIVRGYFGWADLVAQSAKCAALGQIGIAIKSEEERQYHDAHWAAVRSAVGMATDFSKDRAGVETCAATYTSQGLPIFALEDFGSSVVEDDEVHFFRPIDAGRLSGHGGVLSNTLARGETGKDFDHDGGGSQVGHDPLHTHQRDVDFRSRCDISAVTFVSTDGNQARICDGEIDAADAHFGTAKFLPQDFSCEFCHYGRVGWSVVIEFFVEEVGDFFLVQMDGRADEMAWFLMGGLDDVLAEIGFNYIYFSGFQKIVEFDFLGDHGFAFDDSGDVVFFRNVGDDSAGLVGLIGKMNVYAGSGEVVNKLFEIAIEIFQDVVSNVFDEASDLFLVGVFGADFHLILISPEGGGGDFFDQAW